MGGIGSFALSQLSPDQIGALQQQTAPVQPTAQPQPATGYSSDISSPSGAPGSTADLEARAAAAPQQTAQTLQQNQPQQPQPGQWSENNPYGAIAKDYQERWQQSQPPPDRGGPIKRLLTNFVGGMGNSMMAEAGLPTQSQQRQQLLQNALLAANHAQAWEEQQGLQRYRSALTDQMTQQTQFNAQMQPLHLQQAQQSLAAGQQALPTVRPVMSADDLTSLGVPSDLAAQYSGKPLSEADMASVKNMAAAGAKQLFDYGNDGTGPNKGIWLMDKNYVPIRQLATVSETGRSVALAKIQAQQQNNLIKSATAPVYAYDPTSKQTVLTTAGAAQQGGMQAIRGVKETDIRNDMHDTRVLNDVAVKSNNLVDSSAALDQDQRQRDMIAWALTQTDNQIKVGAFGTTIPTGWANTLIHSANMNGSSQQTKDYVTNVLSLREASMGLQKVLTGTARANETQIQALQATLPGLETNSAYARQKLGAFTQNVDMLRQGIPRMPGIDVVPIRTWSGPQSSVQQSTGTNPNPGIGESLSTGASAIRDSYHRTLRSLGLEGGRI